MFAFNLTENAWRTVDVKGTPLPDDTKKKAWLKYGFAGYYDPNHNALVLYNGRNHKVWVYRHRL